MTDTVEQSPVSVSVGSLPSRVRPWAAAILGFLVPGLGHQYAGQLRRAALVLCLFPAADAVVLMLVLLLPLRVANVVVPVVVMLGLRALVAAWAARDARGASGLTPRGRSSRWYSLVGTAVLVGAVVNPIWAYAYRTTLVEAYMFPTGSMENTILRGDHVLAAKWTYGWRLPLVESVVFGEHPAKRGDLAVFPFPEDPRRPFLKRVVALPGETVEIRNRVVFVDDRPLNEPYTRFLELPQGRDDFSVLDGSPSHPQPPPALGVRDQWGPTTVPPRSYFVLGDNRDNSRDSRFWGFVAQGDLLGCARVVYWSTDPSTGQVRWDRIGLRLE